MNLVFRYVELGIEGIPVKTLKDILEGNHAVSTSTSSNGIIVLSDRTIIKCVKHYYHSQNSSPSKKKVANECFYVQQGLGITGIANNSCRSCHLRCMDLVRQGSLFRTK